MTQFTLTVSRCGTQWDAQGLNAIGIGHSAFAAIEAWKDQMVSNACDTFILSSEGSTGELEIKDHPS